MWIVNKALYRSDNKLPFDKSNYSPLFVTKDQAQEFAESKIAEILIRYAKTKEDLISFNKPSPNANAFNFRWKALDLVALKKKDLSNSPTVYDKFILANYKQIKEEFEFTAILTWDKVDLPSEMESALKLMGLL
jgi:hypothetical protein